MASTRLQQAKILRSPDVLDQLTGALLAAANSVVHELDSTGNHQDRLAFANAILVAPSAQAALMLPALMTNATLQQQAGNPLLASGTPFSDSDVDFVVTSVFDAYANQYAGQQNIGSALRMGS